MRNPIFLFSLDSHTKKAGDECHLFHATSFVYAGYLTFSEHVHRLIPCATSAAWQGWVMPLAWQHHRGTTRTCPHCGKPARMYTSPSLDAPVLDAEA